MKIIKSLKDITTLEIGDAVMFGDVIYLVNKDFGPQYYLDLYGTCCNDKIFKMLNVNKIDFINNLGINARLSSDFPEVKSLEALTAIVSALFKEYEKQNELPKTWEEFCERNKMGDKSCLCDGVIIGTGISKNTVRDTVLIESAEEAQAFRALMQLRQLRKAYIGSWKPNWNMPEIKYVIKVIGGSCYQIIEKDFEISSLSFPTYELARQFITNFKDLIEIAKPLL